MFWFGFQTLLSTLWQNLVVSYFPLRLIRWTTWLLKHYFHSHHVWKSFLVRWSSAKMVTGLKGSLRKRSLLLFPFYASLSLTCRTVCCCSNERKCKRNKPSTGRCSVTTQIPSSKHTVKLCHLQQHRWTERLSYWLKFKSDREGEISYDIPYMWNLKGSDTN